MQQYADLARQMKATPMGAGTVLDNTLIYGVSENFPIRQRMLALVDRPGTGKSADIVVAARHVDG